MRRRIIRSGGGWRDVGPVLDEVRDAGRVPILVGGTGLYFKALTTGPVGGAADPARGA